MEIDIESELEELSNKVRCGEPIGFWQAIAVLEYQARLKSEREAAAKLKRAASPVWRVVDWFRGMFGSAT